MDKTYIIYRRSDEPGDVGAIVETPGGWIAGTGKPVFFIDPLKQVVHHSPTGFEYGYGGSGPADLALSILCDYFDQDPKPYQISRGEFKAQPYYQNFKQAFIAPQGGNCFLITGQQIAEWLEKEGYTDGRK